MIPILVYRDTRTGYALARMSGAACEGGLKKMLRPHYDGRSDCDLSEKSA